MTQLAHEPNTVRFSAAASPNDLPYSLELELVVRDRDVIDALVNQPAGEPRNRYALEALKVGVLALRHASGQVSADLIHRESARLIENMRQAMEEHSRLAHQRMTHSLQEYFDPQSGRFNERVTRLIGKDGELTHFLRGQLDGENSQLARTLVTHVGTESPLMKLLDPQQSAGLLAALRETVEGQLAEQRSLVLKEFSLDNEQGALTRLVRELHTRHGNLSKELQIKIDDVVKEFSLDEDNSALSRLVRNVDRAQRTISSEFSLDNNQSAFSRLKLMLEETQGAIHGSLTLDNDQSPLARLKRELLTILEAQVRTNADFQEEVKGSLRELVARRDEQARSTQHGHTFQSAVHAYIEHQSQQRGDICTFTGDTPGAIKYCKLGDTLVELGPDCSARGARIVIEAKEDASYALARAREEMEKARKNRQAEFGIFAFSKQTAPDNWRPLCRYGNDVFVVWDSQDPLTDPYLAAALEISRALCFNLQQRRDTQSADFIGIDKAILDIEKRANNLDDIRKSAETIQSSSSNILDRVRIDRQALEKQIATLREKIGDLRNTLAPGAEEG